MICLSNNRLGRLNAFQRLMLQWSELHPYNAVHVYRIARPLAREHLVDSIRQTYLATGLGLVEVDAGDLTYHCQIDHAPEVTVVEGGEDVESALADWVTRELNRPFARPRCKPWRFSALRAGADAHYVIVAYDHWVADSVAARYVLQHVLDRYCGWNRPENLRPLDLYPGTFREVFPHRLGTARLLQAGVHSLGQWMGNRAVAQVPYASSRQMDIRFECYRAADGTAWRLREFARSLGATVHDVVLAALGRAMAAHLPRRAMRKGRSLSLGTIVDVRGEAQEDLSDSLGAFLSYFLVRLAADRSMSLTEAVRRVAAATGPIKARRTYLNSMLNMKLAGAVWPHLRETAKPFFMRKTLPMTAGVSNVVIRDRWLTDAAAGDVTEYIRAASTGPILPLVLSPTTLGEEVNVGVSYRTAGFSRGKIADVMDLFMEQIERPGDAPATFPASPHTAHLHTAPEKLGLAVSAG
jgi:NRPS condensation-like uncharacterized protein